MFTSIRNAPSLQSLAASSLNDLPDRELLRGQLPPRLQRYADSRLLMPVERDRRGLTPLMQQVGLCAKDDISETNRLIAALDGPIGQTVNHSVHRGRGNDDLGKTALAFAVQNGNLKLAEKLVSCGADVNILVHGPAVQGGSHADFGNFGDFRRNYTPLMAAVSLKDMDMVKFLLAHGANPNLGSAYDSVPNGCLGMFPERGTPAILEVLLEHGMRVPGQATHATAYFQDIKRTGQHFTGSLESDEYRGDQKALEKAWACRQKSAAHGCPYYDNPRFGGEHFVMPAGLSVRTARQTPA